MRDRIEKKSMELKLGRWKNVILDSYQQLQRKLLFYNQW